MPNPRQILVIDDNPDVLHVACNRLGAAGFEPIRAADGVEALRCMVDYPECRQMVTDFTMPHLGGIYWVKLLERFCADWNIVVVSAGDIDPGPFISVPKPVDFENLVQLFSRAEAR